MAKTSFPLVMKATTATAAGLTLALAGLYRVQPQSWSLAAAISAGVTAYHFGMRLAVGWLLLKLTGYRFSYRHPWFRPRAWEPALYRRLRLRRWKPYLPTYAPESYDLTKNALIQVIRATCGAEVVHEVIMVLSFLPLALVPWFGEFGVFFVTSLLSALIDSLFVMAQRFNRPRLVRIYEKQECSAL